MPESATYEEQHVRLLEGLAASIREKGLARTQLTDIVRHARASRRTFYKHFPDKDACFVELTRRTTEIVRAYVVESLDAEADWRTQIDQGLDAFLTALAADRAMAITFSSASLGESVVRAQRDAIEAWAQLIVEIAAGHAERGADVPELSIERAYMLVAGLHLTVVRAVERGDDVLALAPEFKTVFKTAMAAGDQGSTSPRRIA